MKSKTKNLVSLEQLKNQLAHFGCPQKNVNFEGFYDVLKIKILPRVRPNGLIFLNWTHKNIPDQHHIAHFRKSNKIAISLHPTGQADLLSSPPRAGPA